MRLPWLIVSVALVFIVSTIGCVPPQPYVSKETESIVECTGKSKDDIFNRTRQWFSQYFVSGKSVVDYENREAGTIIGNGIAENGHDLLGIIKYHFHYNIRIDIKDGKFRTTTKIIKHTNTDSQHTYDVNYLSQERENSAIAQINKTIADIKSYVEDPKNTKSLW